MKTYRIGVIGLGQRIAHVIYAMKEMGWQIEIAGYSDPAPVGLTILAEHDIPPGPRPCQHKIASWPRGRSIS